MRKDLLVLIAASAIAGPALAQTAPAGAGHGHWQQDMTRAQAQQRADMMFQHLDLNHDGTVTRQEAAQAAQQLAGGDGGAHAERMINRVFGDALGRDNGSGRSAGAGPLRPRGSQPRRRRDGGRAPAGTRRAIGPGWPQRRSAELSGKVVFTLLPSNMRCAIRRLAAKGGDPSKSSALQRSLAEAGSIDQNMLRYVLDQSLDCIKILGPAGEVKYVISHGRCALEIDDFSAIEDRPWPELWPEGSREIIARAVERAQAGHGSEIEASRPDPRGEERWWRISVSPLAERDGELVGMLTISRDVTDAMLLRETEQTLALEMRHRLRNAYTIASAIVMQSARGNADALPFAEMVCGRLADVAISQTQLLEAGDKSWSLAELSAP